MLLKTAIYSRDDIMTYSLGWFSSGEVKSAEGRRAARELLSTVIDAKEGGVLNVDISFVFSNIEPGERPYGDQFFQLVQTYDIPLVTLSSARFAPNRIHGSRTVKFFSVSSDE